jgi:bifunctional non-homologous end joining protein LigD
VKEHGGGSGRAAMPDLVRPMLATPGELPADGEPGRWSYEMKWDGVRAVSYVGQDRVRVLTRNDREVSATYPELGELAPALAGREAVLDGEVVAFPLPYSERRGALDALGLQAPHVLVPPVFVGDGAAALEASRQQRLEGVLAKQTRARYEPGRRSPAWVKVKHVRTQEVVIGGWRPGKGNRLGGIGSLLVGIPGPEGLVYAGHVGTGFTGPALANLQALLEPSRRDSAPFVGTLPTADTRDAVWVEPCEVGEVAFAQWTQDGRLRHPVWRGLRPDKAPADVVLESETP